MGNALIIGAGAIGRGYIPWELKNFSITFFDANVSLMNEMKERGCYRSFMSKNDVLNEYVIDSERSFSDFDSIDINVFDIAFICVGPRNVSKVDKRFAQLTCPIFSLENDPITVDVLKNHLGKDNIYFGVPDVITSLTASPENLIKDPLALHTENGVLYLEDTPFISNKLKDLTPTIEWVNKEKMESEWDAKLFIHNTPHCIAAFLGYLCGATYVHEALQEKKIKLILEGVVDEVLQMLKLTTEHDHSFMEWYAKKEISRFSNTLLFDPVLRVAREPIRKLLPGGRLLGAIRKSISCGIVPKNLVIGAIAAMQYHEERDNDYEIISNIPKMGVKSFLKYYLDIDPDSSEGILLVRAYEEIGDKIL